MEIPSKECQGCGTVYYKKLNVSCKNWGLSKYCSRSCTQQYKANPQLIKFQLKKGSQLGKNTQFKKGQLTGTENNKWKGDNASYAAKHIWVRYHFGSPQGCDHCGTTIKRMYHWANISKTYMRDRDDWLRLCVPCHKKYDIERLT